MGISLSTAAESRNNSNYNQNQLKSVENYHLEMQRLNALSGSNKASNPIDNSREKSRNNSELDKDKSHSIFNNSHPVSCISQIPTKGILRLQYLKKRVTKFKRKMNSNNVDYSKVFNEFLSNWTLRELQALKHEFDAINMLKEITKQVDSCRPSISLLSNDFDVLFKTGLCADTELTYRGEIFPVHRAILAIRSTFFRKCFQAWDNQPDLTHSCSLQQQQSTDLSHSEHSTASATSLHASSTSTDMIHGARNCCIPINIDNPAISTDIFQSVLQYIYTEELQFDETQLDNWEMIFLLRDKFHLPNRLQLDMKRLFESISSPANSHSSCSLSTQQYYTDCIVCFAQTPPHYYYYDCAITANSAASSSCVGASSLLEFLPFDRSTTDQDVSNLINFQRHYHTNQVNVPAHSAASASSSSCQDNEEQLLASFIAYEPGGYNINSHSNNDNSANNKVYTYEIACHRAVLASRSSFFRRIIEMKQQQQQQHATSSQSTIIITLEENIISHRYARVLLYCIYTGQLNMQLIVCQRALPSFADSSSTTLDLTASINNNNNSSTSNNPPNNGYYSHRFMPNCLCCIYDVMQLYQIGSFLDYKPLCHATEDLLSQNISLDNCLDLLHWSSKSYGSKFIRRHVLNWLRENFLAFTSSKYLALITQLQLIEIIDSPLVEAPESEILNAIIKWIELKIEPNESNKATEQDTNSNSNGTTSTTQSTSTSFMFILREFYSRRYSSRNKYQNDPHIAQAIQVFLPYIQFQHIYPGSDSQLNSLLRRGIIPHNIAASSHQHSNHKRSWSRLIYTQDILLSTPTAALINPSSRRCNLQSLDLQSTINPDNTHHYVDNFHGPRFYQVHYDRVKQALLDRANNSHGCNTTASNTKSSFFCEDYLASSAVNPHFTLRTKKPSAATSAAPSTIVSHSNSSNYLNYRMISALFKRVKDLQATPIIQQGLIMPCVNWNQLFHLLRLQALREYGLGDELIDDIFPDFTTTISGTGNASTSAASKYSRQQQQHHLPLPVTSQQQQQHHHYRNSLHSSRMSFHPTDYSFIDRDIQHNKNLSKDAVSNISHKSLCAKDDSYPLAHYFPQNPSTLNSSQRSVSSSLIAPQTPPESLPQSQAIAAALSSSDSTRYLPQGSQTVKLSRRSHFCFDPTSNTSPNLPCRNAVATTQALTSAPPPPPHHNKTNNNRVNPHSRYSSLSTNQLNTLTNSHQLPTQQQQQLVCQCRNNQDYSYLAAGDSGLGGAGGNSSVLLLPSTLELYCYTHNHNAHRHKYRSMIYPPDWISSHQLPAQTHHQQLFHYSSQLKQQQAQQTPHRHSMKLSHNTSTANSNNISTATLGRNTNSRHRQHDMSTSSTSGSCAYSNIVQAYSTSTLPNRTSNLTLANQHSSPGGDVAYDRSSRELPPAVPLHKNSANRSMTKPILNAASSMIRLGSNCLYDTNIGLDIDDVDAEDHGNPLMYNKPSQHNPEDIWCRGDEVDCSRINNNNNNNSSSTSSYNPWVFNGFNFRSSNSLLLDEAESSTNSQHHHMISQQPQRLPQHQSNNSLTVNTKSSTAVTSIAVCLSDAATTAVTSHTNLPISINVAAANVGVGTSNNSNAHSPLYGVRKPSSSSSASSSSSSGQSPHQLNHRQQQQNHHHHLRRQHHHHHHHQGHASSASTSNVAAAAASTNTSTNSHQYASTSASTLAINSSVGSNISSYEISQEVEL